MTRLERYRQALAALPDGAEAAEINIKYQDDTSLSVRGGRQTDCSSYTRLSAGVLVSSGGNTGGVSTECPDDDPAELAAQALEHARYVNSPQKIEAGVPVHVRLPEDHCTPEDMRAFALALESAALCTPGVTSLTHCSVRKRILRYRQLNTSGADNLYEEIACIAGLGIKGSAPGGGTVSGHVSVYAEDFGRLDPAQLAQSAIAKARLLHSGQPAEKLRPGLYDAVVSSEIVASMMVISWMGLVRGHTQKTSPVYPFDPSAILNYRPSGRETWSNGAKDRGCAPPPRGGVLTMPANLTSPLTLVSTPSRLYIGKGEQSLESLLNGLGDGLFITNAFDIIHSIEPSTGDFSILCDGIVYRGGAPISRFQRAVLSGNMQQFMRTIEAAADDLTLNEFMNSSYAYGGPSILVRSLRFSG